MSDKLFNFMHFSISNDDNGDYTSESLLFGIANHLHISGMLGAAGDGGLGSINGNAPFSSPDDFISKVNWAACVQYESPKYRDHKKRVLNRKIGNVPSDFLNQARQFSQRSGLPLSALILAGQSEGSFRNCPKNSDGYGGYFGSKFGPEGSFDTQAQTVVTSWNTAKNNSPGASELEILVLMYISHQLPVVGSRYWKQTGGKIWSTDPTFIVNNEKICYEAGCKDGKYRIGGDRCSEALTINLSAQYMALQLKEKSF